MCICNLRRNIPFQIITLLVGIGIVTIAMYNNTVKSVTYRCYYVYSDNYSNCEYNIKKLASYLIVYAYSNEGVLPGSKNRNGNDAYPGWAQDMLDSWEYVGADTSLLKPLFKCPNDNTSAKVSYDMLLPGIDIRSMSKEKRQKTLFIKEKNFKQSHGWEKPLNGAMSNRNW